MKQITKIVGVSLLLAATSMSAQAQLVLDTFTYTGSGEVIFNADGAATPFPDTGNDIDPVTGVAGTVVGTTVAGGVATYDFSSTSGGIVDPTLTTGAGTLDIFSGNNPWDLNLSYSDYGTSNPQNFTAQGTDFYFDVVNADFGNGASFSTTVSVYSDAGVSTADLSIPSGVINNETLYLSFSDFVGTADFSAVTGVVASLSAGGGFDLSLSEVGVVPEPSALAILGLGLVGLGLRRRKLV